MSIVELMILTIEHLTEYHYPKPAYDSFNELHLQPADDYRQTLVSFDLEVDPHTPMRSHKDYFENMTHHFHLADTHTLLKVRSKSKVSTYMIPLPQPTPAAILPELRHRFFEYLAPTKRVPLNQDWLEPFNVRPLLPDDELVGYLEYLTHHLKNTLTYQPESTDLDTTLAEFSQTRTGVCQDYAHAMLAICRGEGIPARYVSGYVHSNPRGDETMIGGEGSHAWIEAFLPGSGWVGYDPTNACLINEAHIKIGVGRDYDDVPPFRGLRRGGGRETLDVTVKVRHARDAVAK
jgi:transglutaminase-like putative cysteine protease